MASDERAGEVAHSHTLTEESQPDDYDDVSTTSARSMGFCDPSQSLAERVSDLLGRLTTQEKLSLMGAHGKEICTFVDGGIPWLDIPAYTWSTETNTGVSTGCLREGKCATTFPSPAALAASFNRSLWRSKGATLSTEQRALFNLGALRHPHGGVDLNTGVPFFQAGGLQQSLAAGTVNINTIDTALNRSLLWKFRLGLFDSPAKQSYSKLGGESINTSTAQALVDDVAAQGLVLLRNEDSLLPLGEGVKVAVVGSHALATRELLSDYYGDEVCYGKPSGNPRTADGCIVTIGSSVSAANARSGGETRVVPGVGVTELSNTSGLALEAVQWADVVVLALGLSHQLEHEGIDRRDTELPASQLAFAQKVLVAGRKVILVLVNGAYIVLADSNHPIP
eukprot:COSAG06_NODE_2221_length_7313_cov_6.831577_2_plen_395_part_00